MKKILLFVLSLAPFIVMAQDVDSLYNVYQNARRGEKIETANLLAERFFNEGALSKSYQFTKSTPSDYIETIVNYGMEKMAYLSHDFSTMQHYVEIALQHVNPDSLDLYSTLQNHLSVSSFYSGDYETAIASCEKYIEFSSRNNKMREAATAYNTLSACCKESDDLKSAIQFCEKAVEIVRQYCPDDTYLLAAYLGKLSEYQNLDKQVDEAFASINEAIAIDSTDGRTDMLALRLGQKGHIFYKQRKYDTAKMLYEQAIDEIDREKHKASYISLLYSLGQVEYCLGEKKKAIAYFEEEISERKIAGMIDLRNPYFLLSKCYEKEDPAQALSYFKEYHHLQDSLMRVEKQEQLLEFQVKYETAEKEKVIEMQKLENQRKSNQVHTLLGIAIMLFITAATTAYFLYLRRRRAKELKEMNDMKDKLISIISHDMKNSIIAQKNVLRMICESFEALPPEVIKKECLLLKDSACATEELLMNMLQWVSLEIGKSSYNPIPVDLSQVAEQAIKMVSAQAETKGVALTNGIVRETIAIADTNIIGTTLRNLLTNAIKFSPSGKTVRIAVTDAGESQYQIAVIDQGTGMGEDKLKEIAQMNCKPVNGTNGEIGTGLGLFFCIEMLKRGGSLLQFESTLGEGTIAKFNVMKK